MGWARDLHNNIYIYFLKKTEHIFMFFNLNFFLISHKILS